ncbi:phage holin family protein [Paenibacillus sp. IHBB 3054]|uniref:phage holin family protein n=1 Tax=Paenibacillus sp. IHBB 3054 TaxID=3425689 RepID=UPI003F6619A0
MTKSQIAASTIGAVLVPVFDFMYGEADAVVTIMAALLFFVVMDWLSGIRAAKKDNTYASKYGIDGIFRTFFMLLLPAGGHLLDMVFGLPGAIFGALAIGTLYHVLQSMTANAIRAGWGDWLPLSVMDWIIKWAGSELDKKIKRAASRSGGEG